MSRTPHTAWRYGRRFAADALVGFTIFMSVVVFVGGTHPEAEPSLPGDLLAFSTDAGELTRGAGELPGPAVSMAQAAVPVPVNNSMIEARRLEPPSLPLLAVVVSLLIAIDLAFLRHLRRVYASSRRGGWRRG